MNFLTYQGITLDSDRQLVVQKGYFKKAVQCYQAQINKKRPVTIDQFFKKPSK